MTYTKPHPMKTPDDVTNIPLIIHGTDVFDETESRTYTSIGCRFHAADLSDCQEALQSSGKAFQSWSRTSPLERRRLLLHLAQLLRQREKEIQDIIQTEIHCSEVWATQNVRDSISLIETSASLITSRSMSGSIPHTEGERSFGFVFNRPMGVILGIAPWNAPLVLGFRAVVAPIAMGNTAILKGSELSPRTHHFIAQLFVEAGFPPGVVNFILHRPEDAADVVNALVTHPAVRKVNFTGSTAVGRIIAETAGRALKPVLLELGGKNCSIVLKDADVEKAAEAILQGRSAFKETLRNKVKNLRATSHKAISTRGAAKSLSLMEEAREKGAKVVSAATETQTNGRGPQDVPVTLIEDLETSMDFFSAESFGPLIGVVAVSTVDEAVKIVNENEYGLSCAIWTGNHHQALELAQRIDTGAVHVNASTVHDEATLPHGGSKTSGFGRFGAEWGLEEFVKTQTVILNP
uniref:Aldehyde dehydrogenase domain-containing protein n=1 Tax=Bionectria ochroleuca TaxID=29856 RepID=A0A8H7ND82_BIOOC